jgi:hypothetical protein
VAEGEEMRLYGVKPATQSDANREFKSPRHTEWQWFVIALVMFAIMDFLTGWG